MDGQSSLALMAMKLLGPYWAISDNGFDEAVARLAVQAGSRGPWSSAGSSRQFRDGAVAVLPLHGVITQRPGFFGMLGLGTSTIDFGRAFDRAIGDDGIKAIVLDVDSGGGTVSGVSELADKIYAGRRHKHIVAVANSTMASAAYVIAAAAHEVVASPGALLGSLGIVVIHTEFSGMNARLGIKPTIIRAGKFKVEGNELEPLSDAARGHIQAIINDFDDAFIQSIATARGVSVATVRSRFGEGRTITARDAVRRGMAGRIATLLEVVEGLSRRFDRSSKDYSARSAKSLSQRRLEMICETDSEKEHNERRLKLRRALLGVEGGGH